MSFLNKYMEEIILDGETLDLDKIVKISRYKFPVKIDERCLEKVIRCRNTVEELVRDKKVVYGLTTGFASFKNVAINEDQTEELQKNLIESHCVGVGKPFDEEIVRAAIVVRINSLIKGCSGIRVKVLETLIEMLNRQVYPYVPEQGSVGSSGDLAPLSHTMLVLMGKGRAFHEGKIISCFSSELFLSTYFPLQSLAISPFADLSYKSQGAKVYCVEQVSVKAFLQIKSSCQGCPENTSLYTTARSFTLSGVIFSRVIFTINFYRINTI